MKITSKTVYFVEGDSKITLRTPCNKLEVWGDGGGVVIHADSDIVVLCHNDNGHLRWRDLTFEQFREGIKKGFDL